MMGMFLCPLCSDPVEPLGAVDADGNEVIAGWCERCGEYVVADEDAA